MDDEERRVIRETCIRHNVYVLSTEPFGDSIIDKLIPVEEVTKRGLTLKQIDELIKEKRKLK